MLRKVLVCFAAVVVVGASFVPEDALAAYRGRGARVSNFGGGTARSIGGYRGGRYAVAGRGYRAAAYRGSAYRGAAIGAAAVGAAAVGAATYGGYYGGYNNGYGYYGGYPGGYYGGGYTVGTPAGGWYAPQSYGSPNSGGGLVGGSSNGVRPY
jgi:hypothetical protein